VSSPRVDDPGIADDAVLWRRIPPDKVAVLPDGNLRPESWVFGDDEDGQPVSIVIAGPEAAVADVMRGHEGYGLVAFTAADARRHGLAVRRDPTPGQPAHGVLIGPKTRGVRRALAKACRWIVLPGTHPKE